MAGSRPLLIPCVSLFVFSSSAILYAQTAASEAVQEFTVPGSENRPAADPVKAIDSVALVADRGTPLRLALDKRISIKHAGATAEAEVMEPVYAFDREVIPKGSQVTGRVTEVKPAAASKRVRAIMAGNLTPLHEARLEFDTLVLPNGKRMPLTTKVVPGAPEMIRLGTKDAAESRKGLPAQAVDQAREDIKQAKDQAMDAIRSPGKVAQEIKSGLIAQLPYHAQAIPAGARFDAELQAPLDFGKALCPAEELAAVGSPAPPGSVVHARLVTPLSSATARPGAPVTAVITQPLFTPEHKLIFPVGSELEGSVVRAKPARRLDRTGQLRFSFRQVTPPAGVAQMVDGSLEGVAVPAKSNIHLDSEGGASAASPKSSYAIPALEVMLAMSSLDGLDGKAELQHDANQPGHQAANGGVGFGLVGVAAGLSSRFAAAGLGFYGAGWSIYTRVLARGSEVVFPKGTPVEISFGSHHRPAAQVSGNPKHLVGTAEPRT